MARTTVFRVVAAIVVAAASILPAAADEPAEPEVGSAAVTPMDRPWHLRIGPVLADSGAGSRVAAGPGSVSVSFGAGGGGGIGLERRVTPLFAVEFGAASVVSNIDVATSAGSKIASADVDALTTTPLFLGVNLHFVHDGPVDVYAGPLVAYNSYSRLSVRAGSDDWWPPWEETEASVTVASDRTSELAWGGKAGFDVFLGARRRWTLGCSLTYLAASYEFSGDAEWGNTSVSLDPLLVGFGIGFRF